MLLYLLLLFATNLDPIYGKAILSAASPVSLSQVNCGWQFTLFCCAWHLTFLHQLWALIWVSLQLAANFQARTQTTVSYFSSERCSQSLVQDEILSGETAEWYQGPLVVSEPSG